LLIKNGLVPYSALTIHLISVHRFKFKETNKYGDFDPVNKDGTAVN